MEEDGIDWPFEKDEQEDPRKVAQKRAFKEAVEKRYEAIVEEVASDWKWEGDREDWRREAYNRLWSEVDEICRKLC